MEVGGGDVDIYIFIVFLFRNATLKLNVAKIQIKDRYLSDMYYQMIKKVCV